ncbi:unnamed protein product [Brachionus calyciflorus]|uniref:SET domain-containing protein n=1 Tax=Brachionus calyciflorus TaxID=104777 RepID=A0A814BCS4_9BILA|nr:unnamed protein product [Brachionus calyciflorus]
MNIFQIISLLLLPVSEISLSNNDEQSDEEIFEEYENANEVFPHFFNITYLNEQTPNYEHMRTYLKETPNKGIGVFAKRKILADRLVMLYKLKIFNYDNYNSLSGGEYSFKVLKRLENGTEITEESKTADIFDETFGKPRGRIPFWGFLSNEPSLNQSENVRCEIDNQKDVYEEGDIIIYKFLADRDIEKDEEITWCYGDSYIRDYESNC